LYKSNLFVAAYGTQSIAKFSPSTKQFSKLNFTCNKCSSYHKVFSIHDRLFITDQDATYEIDTDGNLLGQLETKAANDWYYANPVEYEGKVYLIRTAGELSSFNLESKTFTTEIKNVQSASQ
jgi:hypothetical protein